MRYEHLAAMRERLGRRLARPKKFGEKRWVTHVDRELVRKGKPVEKFDVVERGEHAPGMKKDKIERLTTEKIGNKVVRRFDQKGYGKALLSHGTKDMGKRLDEIRSRVQRARITRRTKKAPAPVAKVDIKVKLNGRRRVPRRKPKTRRRRKQIHRILFLYEGKPSTAVGGTGTLVTASGTRLGAVETAYADIVKSAALQWSGDEDDFQGLFRELLTVAPGNTNAVLRGVKLADIGLATCAIANVLYKIKETYSFIGSAVPGYAADIDAFMQRLKSGTATYEDAQKTVSQVVASIITSAGSIQQIFGNISAIDPTRVSGAIGKEYVHVYVNYCIYATFMDIVTVIHAAMGGDIGKSIIDTTGKPIASGVGEPFISDEEKDRIMNAIETEKLGMGGKFGQKLQILQNQIDVDKERRTTRVGDATLAKMGGISLSRITEELQTDVLNTTDVYPEILGGKFVTGNITKFIRERMKMVQRLIPFNLSNNLTFAVYDAPDTLVSLGVDKLIYPDNTTRYDKLRDGLKTSELFEIEGRSRRMVLALQHVQLLKYIIADKTEYAVPRNVPKFIKDAAAAGTGVEMSGIKVPADIVAQIVKHGGSPAIAGWVDDLRRAATTLKGSALVDKITELRSDFGATK